MGGLFGSAPKPTNPKVTAREQMRVNRDSAELGKEFNRINQYDPFGSSVTYDPTTGAQSVSLGDLGRMYQEGLTNAGQQYFGTAGQGVPDYNAGFQQAAQFYDANMDPRLERSRAATESRLRNQGLDPTSAAYKSAMGDLALQQNEARNNWMAGAQNQFFNQGLQSRQQTLGELQPGLAFGNMALSPQTQPFAQVSTGQTPDMGELYNNYDKQRMQNYSSKMSGFGTLAGLGLKAFSGGLF